MKQSFWTMTLAVVLAIGALWAAPAQAQQLCPEGQVTSQDTGGRCCWPGQAWSKTKNRCIGAPDCPTGFDVQGEDCQKRGGGAIAGQNNQFIRTITPNAFRKAVERLGWKVVGEETRLNDQSITLPIVKNLDGGAASLNEFDVSDASDIFEETMTQNADAVVLRDGNRFITIVMPGKRAIAEQLMRELTGTSGGAISTQGHGGGDAVAAMTPDRMLQRAKEMGWNVIGEPTRLNSGSITLPVTKGSLGGAFSLNEFEVSDATTIFVDTMAQNDGAVTQRSGNKVVSVIMPGNKPEAQRLLQELLSGGGGAQGVVGGQTSQVNAFVATLNPAKVEAKVKKLGWQTVGEATRLNAGSVTLPVVKGTTGGAVSLNEFDNSVATNAFIETMAKNDGAVMAYSGNKILTVIMPGKKDEAVRLLAELLKK